MQATVGLHGVCAHRIVRRNPGLKNETWGNRLIAAQVYVREESDAWELLLLGCRGRFLVFDEDVGLMAAHTGSAFHEGIGLQLRHLFGVTGFAGA